MTDTHTPDRKPTPTTPDENVVDQGREARKSSLGQETGAANPGERDGRAATGGDGAAGAGGPNGFGRGS